MISTFPGSSALLTLAVQSHIEVPLLTGESDSLVLANEEIPRRILTPEKHTACAEM